MGRMWTPSETLTRVTLKQINANTENKFCTVCGREMRLRATKEGYDRFTGERLIEIRTECPAIGEKRGLFRRLVEHFALGEASHDSWWLGGLRQSEFDALDEETKRKFVVDEKRPQ